MTKYIYNFKDIYEETEVAYYLLGAFITDGCVSLCSNKISKQVFLTSKDENWINIIKNIFSPNLKIQQNKNGTYILGIYSNEFARWLESHNCTERKSLQVKFPTVPEKYLPDFIRGCIDGDGCISICKNTKNYKGKITTYNEWKCYLCSSSVDFISSYKEHLRLNDINFTFTERKTNISYIDGRKIEQKHPHYRVIVSTKNCAKLINWAYYPGHKISMPRKNELAKQIINKYQNYLITM